MKSFNEIVKEVEEAIGVEEQEMTNTKMKHCELDSIKKDLEVLEALLKYEQVKKKVRDLYFEMEDLYASGDRTVDVSVVSRKLMDVLYIFM